MFYFYFVSLSALGTHVPACRRRHINRNVSVEFSNSSSSSSSSLYKFRPRKCHPKNCGQRQNLDALHDHLGLLYPGMRAPSFRCTEEPDGSLILHYYSDRGGLEYIVIGIVKVSCVQLKKRKKREKSEENSIFASFSLFLAAGGRIKAARRRGRHKDN